MVLVDIGRQWRVTGEVDQSYEFFKLGEYVFNKVTLTKICFTRSYFRRLGIRNPELIGVGNWTRMILLTVEKEYSCLHEDVKCILSSAVEIKDGLSSRTELLNVLQDCQILRCIILCDSVADADGVHPLVHEIRDERQFNPWRNIVAISVVTCW